MMRAVHQSLAIGRHCRAKSSRRVEVGPRAVVREHDGLLLAGCQVAPLDRPLGDGAEFDGPGVARVVEKAAVPRRGGANRTGAIVGIVSRGGVDRDYDSCGAAGARVELPQIVGIQIGVVLGDEDRGAIGRPCRRDEHRVVVPGGDLFQVSAIHARNPYIFRPRAVAQERQAGAVRREGRLRVIGKTCGHRPRRAARYR